MNLSFSSSWARGDVFLQLEDYLRDFEFHITTKDEGRPWGGFFVIDEKDSDRFLALFYSSLKPADFPAGYKLSPKVLIVAPQKRLSWQYHHRRAELWKLIGGSASVITSETDREGAAILFKEGDTFVLKQGMRHRLIGGEGWAVVAEIWQHTDGTHPSNEDDIVRLQDDFGR